MSILSPAEMDDESLDDAITHFEFLLKESTNNPSEYARAQHNARVVERNKRRQQGRSL